MIVRIIRAKSVQRYNPQELVLPSPIKITRLNHPQEDPENTRVAASSFFLFRLGKGLGRVDLLYMFCVHTSYGVQLAHPQNPRSVYIVPNEPTCI